MNHPAPGIHGGIEFADYAEWPLINSGLIRAGRFSMRRMKWMFDGRMEMDDSRDRKFGRGFHCRLLEPDTFDFRFTVQEQCAATKKGDGEPCQKPGALMHGGKWYCKTKGHAPDDATEPEECITAEEIDRMDAMIEALEDHDAIKMLRQHGGHEESAIAEVNGVLCKARFDKRIPGGRVPPTIVDIKKTRFDKIQQWDCDKSIANYQYDMQMAFYCRIAEVLTGERHKGIWVFVADRPDYDVCVRMMPPEMYEECSAKIDGVLRDWQDCNARGVWPGVAPTIEYVGEFKQTRLQEAAA